MKNFVFPASALLLSALACITITFQNNSATPPLGLKSAPASGIIVEVPADAGWGDTGMVVRAGQIVRIAYLAGQVVDGKDIIPDAAGTNYVCGRASCCEPLPNAPRGSLIGRLGGNVFFIGNGGEIAMPENGRLELRVNDCDAGLYDNRGSLQIIILP
jgi:hypothetical protein